jgi:hypothetical protein
MSRIGPDLPELERVPAALRSIVYTQAFTLAMRSPFTWGAGAIAMAVGVGIGANQGSALAGRGGAALGILVGAGAAIWGFFKFIVPWRTRRLLPSVMNDAGTALRGREE